MKIASGANTPADGVYMIDEHPQLALLKQTRVVPTEEGLRRRKDLSPSDLVAVIDFLDSAAPQLAKLRAEELGGEVEQYTEAISRATYRTQKVSLLHDRARLLAAIDYLNDDPVLWVCSTKLYRRLLRDVGHKMFGHFR